MVVPGGGAVPYERGTPVGHAGHLGFLVTLLLHLPDCYLLQSPGTFPLHSWRMCAANPARQLENSLTVSTSEAALGEETMSWSHSVLEPFFVGYRIGSGRLLVGHAGHLGFLVTLLLQLPDRMCAANPTCQLENSLTVNPGEAEVGGDITSWSHFALEPFGVG